MVSLEWYQSFVAVYQVGTVTGAAEARFLTQPAVTQHLAALESVIGEPLFQRTPRRMLPTQRGKELYSQVIQSLERLAQVSEDLRSVDKRQIQQPLIRLGTPREYFLDIALNQLAELPFRFWIQFGVTGDLIASLEQGELDLIIATQRTASRQLEFHKLAEENFVLVCATQQRNLLVASLMGQMIADGEAQESFRSQSELEASSSSESLMEQPNLKSIEKWLTTQKWISYGLELPIIRRFWQITFKNRPEFQPALVIPDLHSIGKAVELGYGISLLPDYLCADGLKQARLQILWQAPKPTINELWLAYRKIERNRFELKQIQTKLGAK